MMKTIISIFLIAQSLLCFSQTDSKIDSLLGALSDVARAADLSTRPPAIQIMNYGSDALPVLAKHFSDTSVTQVISDCQNIYLTKGEIAIIIADRIEIMPYMMLTGIQNCILEFCRDNPNWVEYYLSAIRRDGVISFQKKYLNWLKSKDRRKFWSYLRNKKKKK
jgi:hypothetical protein